MEDSDPSLVMFSNGPTRKSNLRFPYVCMAWKVPYGKWSGSSQVDAYLADDLCVDYAKEL